MFDFVKQKLGGFESSSEECSASAISENEHQNSATRIRAVPEKKSAISYSKKFDSDTILHKVFPCLGTSQD